MLKRIFTEDVPRIANNALQQIPLISQLFRASFGEHRGAFREFLYTWIFSSALPIGINVGTKLLNQDPSEGGNGSLLSLILSIIYYRETLIFCTTIMATALYVIIRYNEDERKLEGLYSFHLIGLITIFALQTAYGFDVAQKVNNKSLMNQLCLWSYLLCLLIWYIALLLNNRLNAALISNYSQKLRQSENLLQNELSKFSGK